MFFEYDAVSTGGVMDAPPGENIRWLQVIPFDRHRPAKRADNNEPDTWRDVPLRDGGPTGT
jgi:hypothetical protein